MGEKINAIIVEGNIGSGKTTFINHLRSRMPNALIHEEPLNKWTDLDGCNLLEMMYKDPGRWSTMFQAYAMLTLSKVAYRLGDTNASAKGKFAVLERSVHSCFHVFTKNLYRQRYVNEMEYGILLDCYETWCNDSNVNVNTVVYLKASPSTCMQRIKMRNRPEESDISIESLQQLHDLHDDWLINRKCNVPTSRVLVVNVDRDLPDLLQLYDDRILPELYRFSSEQLSPLNAAIPAKDGLDDIQII